jgi:hypothetical protein
MAVNRTSKTTFYQRRRIKGRALMIRLARRASYSTRFIILRTARRRENKFGNHFIGRQAKRAIPKIPTMDGV